MKYLSLLPILFLMACGSGGGTTPNFLSQNPATPGATPGATPVPTATPSPTPGPTPVATPVPTPSPSPTPGFTKLNCTTFNNNGPQATCTGANLGTSQITMDFSPYLTPTSVVLTITVQNNLGAGEPYGNPQPETCQNEYEGLTDCTCINVTFYDNVQHLAAGPYVWCGTGIDTTKNFLDYLQ
jgi:hypothetical protein